jgi:hypothetical protein
MCSGVKVDVGGWLKRATFGGVALGGTLKRATMSTSTPLQCARDIPETVVERTNHRTQFLGPWLSQVTAIADPCRRQSKLPRTKVDSLAPWVRLRNKF